MTAGERGAHEVLLKALPECVMFAQVPLARFIKVPRRHSYAEWLTRVGHLCADLVICDRSTLVIGGVLLTTFLTLLVIPAVYSVLDRKSYPQAGHAPVPDGLPATG